MRTLLIVDDELHALEGLKASLDWAGLGIRLVSAGSPAEARAAFGRETVDFMFCDIEMPQGSGLELAAWVRANHPLTEIIFLTCHAEFSYARQAVQLGSLDYLLKPATPAELVRAVRKTLERLDQRDQTRRLNDYGAHWVRNQSLLIERFWLDLINQTIAGPADKLWATVAERNLPYLPEMRFRPVVFRIHEWLDAIDRKERRNREFSVRQLFAECFGDPDASPGLVRLDPSTTLALFISQDGAADQGAGLRQACLGFLALCRGRLACTVACYLGECAGLPEVPAQLAALLAAAADNVMGKAGVTELPARQPDSPPPRRADLDTWAILLAAGAQDSVLREAGSFLRQLGQSDRLDLAALQAFQRDFLQMLYVVLGKRQVSAAELLAGAPEPAEPTLAGTLDWLDRLCRRAVGLLRAADDTSRTPVDRARAHIASHLGGPLSCEDIAARVHVHPDHLSRMFKKETGLGLSAWLIRQRMTLAAELIAASQLPISRIALEVGYDNFSHFTRMFRQHAGMTPVEYRRQRQGEDRA